jgi:hypothetical protein
MKIYFTASSRGKKDYSENYRKIYDVIENLGHENLDDLIIQTVDENYFYSGSHDDQMKLFKQTLVNIKSCDMVVLEVSVHSLSMGYVMHKALDMGKPVIALYLKGREPYFALGIENEKLQVVDYELNSIENILKSGLDYAEEQMDTRFNFFISPKIGTYLDWVSRKKRIPRAVYLRRLITEDMKKEKEYDG